MDLTPLTTVAIASDFSEPASVAVAWGHRLAALHGARVVLIHVLGTASDHHLTEDEARRGLDGIAASLRAEGLRVDIEMASGAVASVLHSVAERVGADVLVIGSHGHGVIKRLMIGSVADELLRQARLPLLVVHPRDGQRRIDFRTALVGIDFNDPSQRAAACALRLLERHADSQLLLLAATQIPLTFVGPDAPAMPLVEVTEVNDSARDGIQRLTKALGGHGVRVEGLVCPGAPSEAIMDTAEDRRVDFVAVGSEPRSGAARLLLGSIAKDVIHHAVCPVLVVR